MQITFLGSVLAESMSGEPMSLKVMNKMNWRLKLLYSKYKFLTPELHRMIFNALILPHLDYTCQAWYPILIEKTKKKIQIMQKKCTMYLLQSLDR